MAHSTEYVNYLAGKPGADVPFFQRHFPRALRAASRVLRGRSYNGIDAESVAADTVSTLFEQAPPVDDDDRWTVTVATRNAISATRLRVAVAGIGGNILDGEVDPLDQRSSDVPLRHLLPVLEAIRSATRTYIAEGATPSERDLRNRRALWCFALADPTRAALDSLELFAELRSEADVSDATLWRDRRHVRDVAWPWVRSRATQAWPAADDNTLLDEYLERVTLWLKRNELGDNDE